MGGTLVLAKVGCKHGRCGPVLLACLEAESSDFSNARTSHLLPLMFDGPLLFIFSFVSVSASRVFAAAPVRSEQRTSRVSECSAQDGKGFARKGYLWPLVLHNPLLDRF